MKPSTPNAAPSSALGLFGNANRQKHAFREARRGILQARSAQAFEKALSSGLHVALPYGCRAKGGKPKSLYSFRFPGNSAGVYTFRRHLAGSTARFSSAAL
jgi:hypothetical protein